MDNSFLYYEGIISESEMLHRYSQLSSQLVDSVSFSTFEHARECLLAKSKLVNPAAPIPTSTITPRRSQSSNQRPSSGTTETDVRVTTMSPALPRHTAAAPTSTTTTTSHLVHTHQQPHSAPNESTCGTHALPRQQAVPAPALATPSRECENRSDDRIAYDTRVPREVGHHDKLEGGREMEKRGREEEQAEADGKPQPPPPAVTPERQQGPTPGPCLHPQRTRRRRRHRRHRAKANGRMPSPAPVFAPTASKPAPDSARTMAHGVRHAKRRRRRRRRRACGVPTNTPPTHFAPARPPDPSPDRRANAQLRARQRARCHTCALPMGARTTPQAAPTPGPTPNPAPPSPAPTSIPVHPKMGPDDTPTDMDGPHRAKWRRRHRLRGASIVAPPPGPAPDTIPAWTPDRKARARDHPVAAPRACQHRAPYQPPGVPQPRPQRLCPPHPARSPPRSPDTNGHVILESRDLRAILLVSARPGGTQPHSPTMLTGATTTDTQNLVTACTNFFFRGGRSGCENREQNLEGKVGKEG
jgi:hypothetical protein